MVLRRTARRPLLAVCALVLAPLVLSAGAFVRSEAAAAAAPGLVAAYSFDAGAGSNGVLAGSRAQTGPVTVSAGVLRIGGNTIYANEYFRGLIDEVRIYNRALSAGGCDELVQIDLQVLGRDAVVGALQPGLEVGERAVRAWQDELTVGEACSLFARLVVEPGSAQAAVALPAVAVGDRAGGDAGARTDLTG